jgi:hypothetical protein
MVYIEMKRADGILAPDYEDMKVVQLKELKARSLDASLDK